MEDANGKRYPGFQMEEHVSLTSEPGGEYVANLSPAGNNAETIANALYKFLRALPLQLEFLESGPAMAAFEEE